jgi:hypothetical protein
MLKKESTIVEFYESPKCDVTEILSEGVLCASMQQLYEYEDEFVW